MSYPDDIEFRFEGQPATDWSLSVRCRRFHPSKIFFETTVRFESPLLQCTYAENFSLERMRQFDRDFSSFSKREKDSCSLVGDLQHTVICVSWRASAIQKEAEVAAVLDLQVNSWYPGNSWLYGLGMEIGAKLGVKGLGCSQSFDSVHRFCQRLLRPRAE
jgi:hypothetical protein